MVGVASALAAFGGLTGLLRAADRERIVVWRNWSGGQSCIPADRLAPANEEELAALIRSSAGKIIRPVGSGHSFSPLVPKEGTIVSVAKMSGLISPDNASLQAEV